MYLEFFYRKKKKSVKVKKKKQNKVELSFLKPKAAQ